MGRVAFWGGASAEGPTYLNEDPWSVGWIAGRQLPGITTITGSGIASLQIDNKKGKGRDGSAITIVGYDPKPFNMNVEIWTSDQNDALLDLIDAIWTRPTKKSKLAEVAVQVHHPALDYVHISTAVLIGVEPPKRGSVDGMMLVVFRMHESVLPAKKNSTKTVKGSANDIPLAPNLGPKNGTPEKPSSDKKQLGPKGPPADPGEGSD